MNRDDSLKAVLQLLAQVRQQGRTTHYRKVLDAVPLPRPHMRSLTGLLEQLALADHRQGWPLRAALVVSQAGSELPRQGFFDFLAEQCCVPLLTDTQQQQRWHSAMLNAVYLFEYPGGFPCFGGDCEQRSVIG